MLMRLDQEPPPSPKTIVTATEDISISFPRQVLNRLPLAEAALWLWSYVLNPDFLDGVFQRHRGRSFEDVLSFPVLLDLIADALLQYNGSARPALLRAQRDGTLPTKPRAVYTKLGRVPLELSLGLLEETTARLHRRGTAGQPGGDDHGAPGWQEDQAGRQAAAAGAGHPRQGLRRQAPGRLGPGAGAGRGHGR